MTKITCIVVVIFPIEDELLSYKKQQKMIKDLTDSKYFSEATKANDIIKKDMKRLSKNLSKNIINDFFDIMNEQNNNVKANIEPKRKNNLKPITDEERRILDKIQDFIIDGKKEDAENIISQKLAENIGNTQFVFHLYNMRTTIYRSVPNKEKILIDSFDKLIELMPCRKENYIRAFNSVYDYKIKIKYINRAIELFPNDIDLYNEKAEYLINECLDFWEIEHSQDFISDIKASIDKSLEINNTPNNIAWLLKCDYIKSVNENDIAKARKEIKEIVNTFSYVKSKYLSMVYERYYKLLEMDECSCENKINELYSYFFKANDLASVETSAISLMKFYMKLGRLDDFEKFVKKYESEYIPSEDFDYSKAWAYTKYFALFEKAESVINDYYNNSNKWKNLMFDYLCETKQKDRAKALLTQYFPNDNYKLVQYYNMSNDEKVIEILEKYWVSNPHTISDISVYACACLKHGQEAKAYALCKKYYDKPEYFNGVLYINYFLADQKYNNKDISSKIQKKIIDRKELYSEIVLAAAYALLNDKNHMYSSLSAAIKEKVSYKFDILDWPVFEKYKDEEKFKKLADVSELMNFERKIEI